MAATVTYDASLPLAFRIVRVFGCRIEEVFRDGRGTPAWHAGLAR